MLWNVRKRAFSGASGIRYTGYHATAYLQGTGMNPKAHNIKLYLSVGVCSFLTCNGCQAPVCMWGAGINPKAHNIKICPIIKYEIPFSWVPCPYIFAECRLQNST